jgi:peptidoglycan/LPS O-acetylase OafA/YrhL
VAIVLVVGYHFAPNRITTGFLGVDIFFVIGGYFAFNTISKRILVATNLKLMVQNTIETLVNRIKRIVIPAFITLGTVVLILNQAYPMSIPPRIELLNQVIASATFWQNNYLSDQAVDYLNAQNSATAVWHFWYLAIDMQFFVVLLFGLVILSIALQLSKVKDFADTSAVRNRLVFVVLLISTVVFYCICIETTATSPAQSYFLTTSRVWELLAGATIGAFSAVVQLPNWSSLSSTTSPSNTTNIPDWAYPSSTSTSIPESSKRAQKLLFQALLVLGLIMLGYSLAKFNTANFPGAKVALPVVGTALVIYFGAHFPLLQKVAQFKGFQYLGNISFSLFLWHFPVLILVPKLLGFSSPTSVKVKVILLIIALISAVGSYELVEKRLVNLLDKLTSSGRRSAQIAKRALVLLLIFAILLISATVVKAQTEDFVNHGIGQLHMRAYQALEDVDNSCFGALAIYNLNKCADNAYDYVEPNLLPLYSDQGVNDLAEILELNNGQTCLTNAPESVGYCEVGDTNSEHYWVLVGDSHASSLKWAFDYVGKKLGVKIVVTAQSNCHNQCAEMFAPNLQIYKNADRVFHSVIMCEKTCWPENYNALFDLYPIERTVIIDDYPNNQDQFYDFGNIGPTTYYTQYNQTYQYHSNAEFLAQVASNMVRTPVLNLDDVFCQSATTCSLMIGGIPVYGDKNHMTETFSITLGPLLLQKMQALGLEDVDNMLEDKRRQ